jgi:hypothetical protein
LVLSLLDLTPFIELILHGPIFAKRELQMLVLTFKSLDRCLGCLIFELQNVEYLIHIIDLVVFLLNGLIETQNFRVILSKLLNLYVQLRHECFDLFILDVDFRLVLDFL